jgi:hypothetical protein
VLERYTLFKSSFDWYHAAHLHAIVLTPTVTPTVLTLQYDASVLAVATAAQEDAVMIPRACRSARDTATAWFALFSQQWASGAAVLLDQAQQCTGRAVQPKQRSPTPPAVCKRAEGRVTRVNELLQHANSANLHQLHQEAGREPLATVAHV